MGAPVGDPAVRVPQGRGDRFFSEIEGDLEYDNLFIFDEVGWNFEPSELSAAFGLVQLDKLADNLARRQRNFELTAAHFARWPSLFELPRLTDGIETGWHMFPVLLREESGIRRAEFQRWMEGHGVDTRMVWTNARPGSPRSGTVRCASPRPACRTPTGSWSRGWSCPTAIR
ncbi:MAG: DegT/DnrJ/EryC1/StrS family aminotransferase [Acidimicrobiales bacterium]